MQRNKKIYIFNILQIKSFYYGFLLLTVNLIAKIIISQNYFLVFYCLNKFKQII